MPVGSASAATRHDRAVARACRLPCHVCYMHVPSIAGRHRQTRVRHVVRADACKAKTNRTTAVIRPSVRYAYAAQYVPTPATLALWSFLHKRLACAPLSFVSGGGAAPCWLAGQPAGTIGTRPHGPTQSSGAGPNSQAAGRLSQCMCSRCARGYLYIWITYI